MTAYGRTYEKLVARIQPNRNRQSSGVVAFIGPQLCFLERSSVVPAVGSEVEVMITRAVYGKNPADHKWPGATDAGRLVALMVEVVDPARHLLVAIDGFECSGTMCRTTAHGRVTDGLRPLASEEVYPPKKPRESTPAWLDRTRENSRRTMWLTPGRTDVIVADNVNTRIDAQRPRTPMNVWVSRSRLEETSGCGVRVIGLSSTEDATWSPLVRRASVPQRAAA